VNPYDPPHSSSGAPTSGTVTLTSRVSTGSVLKLQLPVFVLLFFVSWLLFSLFTKFLPIPMPNLLAFVIAVVFMAGLWKYKVGQVENRERNTTLTLSPEGMRRQDHLVVTEMPWSGVDHFEEINTVAPGYVSRGFGLPNLATVFNRTVATAAANSARRVEFSVIGQGSIRRSPDADALGRKHVAQVYGLRDDTPRPSARLVITPTHFEEDWRAGEIGRHLARYRPDLVIPGPEEV